MVGGTLKNLELFGLKIPKSGLAVIRSVELTDFLKPNLRQISLMWRTERSLARKFNFLQAYLTLPATVARG